MKRSKFSDEQILAIVKEGEGLPQLIVLDNGPEFAAARWKPGHAARVTLCFIRPGKPIENAYVESYNGKFRDECLNEHSGSQGNSTAPVSIIPPRVLRFVGRKGRFDSVSAGEHPGLGGTLTGFI